MFIAIPAQHRSAARWQPCRSYAEIIFVCAALFSQ
jgi:hypothetical protein